MGARLLLYGTLIDNNLLNEIESVAIEIVNNTLIKFYSD